MVQCGAIGFEGLLHGAFDDFLQSVGLEDASFGMVTDEWGDYVNAYLYGFLNKPFQTFVVFCGCYGNVEVVVAATIVGNTLCDSYGATFGVGLEYLGVAEGSKSVGEH